MLEARPGGRLHYDMIASAPAQIAAMQQLGRSPSHATRARYTEFKPGEKLAITTVVDFVPGVPPYETVLRVEFFPAGDHVRMVVTLDPMHDEQMTRMSQMGLTARSRSSTGASPSGP